jgi:hypothetical protein
MLRMMFIDNGRGGDAHADAAGAAQVQRGCASDRRNGEIDRGRAA